MSHEVEKAARPTGSNWTEQVAGSAMTLTGARSWAAASAGLPAWARMWKPGKVVTSIRIMPPSMMGLRPTLSDSQPKKT